jgi:hypothetical protein
VKCTVLYSTIATMRRLVALLLFSASFLGVYAVQLAPLQAHLEKQLRSWQRRLSMDDWNLSVQLVRKTALDKDTWGNAEWDSDSKTGIISVLDPQDYNLRGTELKRDMECTIVHELVHIQVSPLDPEHPEAQEEVVNRIMMALLNRPCPN